MKRIASLLLVAILAVQFTIPVFAQAAEETASVAPEVISATEEKETATDEQETPAAPEESTEKAEDATLVLTADEKEEETLEDDNLSSLYNEGNTNIARGSRVEATGDDSLSTSAAGTFDVAGAKGLFFEINKLRFGQKIEGLEWSSVVQKAAETRAMEYAVNGDVKVRPDGSPAATVLGDGEMVWQIIGKNFDSAEKFLATIKEQRPAAITEPDFGSMGIAHYTKDGVQYWCYINSAYWYGYNTAADFVARMYTTALNRDIDEGGFYYWWELLLTGQATGAQVAEDFFGSEEYANKKLSNSAFLDTLYATYMNREADAGGKDFWTVRLENGVGRRGVIAQFTTSPEFANLFSNCGIEVGTITGLEARDQRPDLTMFVYRMYNECLDRKGNVDVGGLNHWCQQLLDGASVPSVAHGFVFSQEMNNRKLSDSDFLKVMYRAFMGRDYDEAGLNHWLGVLTSGSTREDVFNSFAHSAEFKQIASSFGVAF